VGKFGSAMRISRLWMSIVGIATIAFRFELSCHETATFDRHRTSSRRCLRGRLAQRLTGSNVQFGPSIPPLEIPHSEAA
jgi:hypothetical protein